MSSLIKKIALQAKEAALFAAQLSSDQKNKLLMHMAHALIAQKDRIISENKKDVEVGKKNNLSSAMIDRLILNEARIETMAKALMELSKMKDPVSEIVKSYERPNGLKIEKIRIPLGVIGIIYESRPNVTVDAAALCLKSGNAVILRGGSEALMSNSVLAEILREVLQEEGVHRDIIQIIPISEREAMKELLTQDKEIDLIIPRGGSALMDFVREYSKIPVIKHDKGVCHIFVEREANLEKAEKIIINSKVDRPGVCNALETLLIDEKITAEFLPQIVAALKKHGVQIKGCAKCLALVKDIEAASEEDWSTEYLDLILSIKIVSNLDEAIHHIQKYSSLHSEAIISENKAQSEKFLKALNSSVVLVNASTRFNDGGELGLGAEIGISTSKLHAFGPMGLEELTTQKYIVRGDGQIR